MKTIPNSLRVAKPHVVFQECPGEVSLCFSVYGCPLKCSGCHSEDLWNPKGGEPLTPKAFEQHLDLYSGLITAVVFFGGEWQPKSLQVLLKSAQQRSLKTCLYTGLNHVSRHLRPYLDFAKIGPWRKEIGGLSEPDSNQMFFALRNGQFQQDLSHLFHQNPSAQKDAHYAAA